MSGLPAISYIALSPINTMTDKYLQIASQHSSGKGSVDLDMGRALEEKFDFESRPTHGFVDTISGAESEDDDVNF